jgi:protease-4
LGLTGNPQIAFVVAQGDILRGDPESSSVAGEAIESESFTRLLKKVGASSAKGVIVRIDSPGGEVFASDSLWKAMNELRKKKPTVISMSDTAASGGYYMAMNGTPIVAYPGTLTGSIGVVFGKPNLHGLYDKLGIDKDSIGRGRFSGIDSDYHPLNDAEKAKLREGIDANYQVFVQKVADSRRKPFDQIEPVAQGRVWLGDQAKENGLVDELGGIDRAIELVKQRASIGFNEKVTLVTYPARRSLWEVLLGSSAPDSLSDSAIEGRIAEAMGRRSAGTLPALLRLPALQAWLRGGFLSISPWSLSIQ